MDFKWQKKGQLFLPDAKIGWMKEYAQGPIPVPLKDKYRIFFSTRHYPNPDNLPISNIGYIDVKRSDRKKIIGISKKPLLSLGKYGTFDEFGIMPADVIQYDKKTHFMYYTGWTRSAQVPYETAIGLAYSTDNCESFTKISNGPIISKNRHDAILVNGPSIIKKGNTYHMFYSSATKWIDFNNRKEVFYHVKHAISKNAIDWTMNDNFCLTKLDENEVQNAPRVSKIGNTYLMWFCYRKATDFRTKKDSGYRLGLALSNDLNTWVRVDEKKIGIAKSKQGWDSEMMCYPYMIQDKNILSLFYCGNYFGKEGFGYAEMEI